MIRFYQEDNNWIYFSGDRETVLQMRDYFSFFPKGYQYDKRYKIGIWDGRISTIDLVNSRFPAGLLIRVENYLKENGISFNDDDTFDIQNTILSPAEIVEFYKEISGPFEPHESQIDGLIYCLSTTRNILLAPTSNGKSYIIHGLVSHHFFKRRKTLIIIDRSQLVLQLKENLVDEYSASYKVKTIYDKDDSDFDVFITTWQSIYKKEVDFFKQFEVLIIDEIHKAKAKSIKNMMERACHGIIFRHGFTATLDNDCLSDKTNLIGLFGEPKQTITLKSQIKDGISAEPKIFLLNLKYSKSDERILKTFTETALRDCQGEKGAVAFRIEEEFIENHSFRNKQILKCVQALKGNTLVVFKKDAHGRNIHKLISKNISDKTFFINGTVDKKVRFEYQKEILGLKSCVIVASLGVFSTGINIPNLNNLVIVTQIKSEITLPQMIGRMIRITENKKTVNVVDFVDIIGGNNIYKQHADSRVKFYLKNSFQIKEKTLFLDACNS